MDLPFGEHEDFKMRSFEPRAMLPTVAGELLFWVDLNDCQCHHVLLLGLEDGPTMLRRVDRRRKKAASSSSRASEVSAMTKLRES